MKNSKLYYSVGPLLYCPANNSSITRSLTENRFGTGYSLALCLEDTIGDNFVTQAEDILVRSLNTLFKVSQNTAFFMPKIFIRVRRAEQMINLTKRLGNSGEILTGFILPKFEPANAAAYIEAAENIQHTVSHKLYIMPILESPAIIDLRHRARILYELKDRLAAIEEYVLNIRVGGNDLCNQFGIRRHSNESIHSIRPVADIFSDIVTVFGRDYVVSGPVWEYYNGKNWAAELRQELQEDRLCGFIGKTAIHPNQIPLINQAYAVTPEDYRDARSILDWSKDSASLVAGNVQKERMNEQKTHARWAQKILYLSEIYGIRS